MDLKSKIRTIPDFPKPGIMFRDITTLLEDPTAFKKTIDSFRELVKAEEFDAVIGIESRGFIFGAPLALELGCSFVPIRKPGKLPWKTISQSYELEYGTDAVEMHEDAIKKGERVILVDDLIATGGTLKAACKLIERVGAEIALILCVIELVDLKAREKLEGYAIHSLIEFEGD